jgi:hypothetical protein
MHAHRLFSVLSATALLCTGACNNNSSSTPSAAGSSTAQPSAAQASTAGASATAAAHGHAHGADDHGHDHGAAPKSKPAPMGSGNHYGGEFALTKSEPLGTVIGRLSEDKAEKVQVTGVVDKVCQAKGCWMVLKDGDVHARIFTKGHNFFLPMDVAGARATAEGTIKARKLSEKFAKHLAEDSGGDPKKVKGAQREFVMNASAIKLVPNS